MLNTDFYSAWNYRREILLSLYGEAEAGGGAGAEAAGGAAAGGGGAEGGEAKMLTNS